MPQDSTITTATQDNYEKDIQNCEQMRQDSIKSQDKLIITLSSGALALSLTIYEKIYNDLYPWLLIATWICYFISLLSTLFSFITAQHLFDENISCLENLKKGKKMDNKKYKKFYTWTICLNCISLIMFIMASCCFLTFSSINLSHKDINMTKTITQDSLIPNSTMRKILTEGLTPSKNDYIKVENGLTPNNISKITITGNPSSQPDSGQSQSSPNSENK